MSRGPGKIERAIPRSIKRSRKRLGQVHVKVNDIVEDVYGNAIDAVCAALNRIEFPVPTVPTPNATPLPKPPTPTSQPKPSASQS
jgi:hypothetical protein